MKNILICPLDWGMGHATRVLQVADRLHTEGHNVTIAASAPLLKIYDNTNSSNRVIFRSLKVRYSSTIPQYIAVLLQAPLILIQFFADHYNVGRIIKQHNIDIVISDNRFGAWSRRAYSVYITHQLSIKVKGRGGLSEKLLSGIHRYIASLYNECWIPDVNGELTGDLSSHTNRPESTRFIGPLSMLRSCDPIKPDSLPDGKYYAVLISGPEPQRSIIEKLLLKQLAGKPSNYVFAGGDMGVEKSVKTSENITTYSYLTPGEIKYLLANCMGVICRAGYSTLMDLVVLGKSAIIIPTPGQTEQEYLASHLDKMGWFTALSQADTDEIDTDKIIENLHSGDIVKRGDRLFEETLKGLIKRSSSQ